MNQGIPSLAIGALYIGLTLTAAAAPQTATNNPDTTLPMMVVTPTRDARAAQNTPYSTSMLSGDTLRLEQAVRTVPEALKNEPGILIQKTGHGQGSPYIRGFTSQRNLFMIDGIRLNNSVFREGPNQYWNTVDAFALHQIELVRGPFSTLYGSDAIGGTVNAITRGAQDLRKDRNWDRHAYYRYSSAENSHIARIESIGKLTESLTLTLGYTEKSFGDLEGGKSVGTQPKTGYDERDWDAKLEYFINENAHLVLSHQSADVSDAWRTHKTIYGINWKDLSIGSELRRSLDQNRELTSLQFHLYNGDGIAEEIHAGISHHMQSEDRDRLRTRDRHDVQGFEVNTLGGYTSIKSTSPIGTLIYGFEAYHDAVDSYNRNLKPDGSLKSSAIQGPVGDNATYDSIGLYLQDEILLTEKLSLILGVRHEYSAADAKAVEDPTTGDKIAITDSWNATVGSARLSYALNAPKTMSLFTGVSQGFRAPNLSDLTRLDTARTDEIETPAPNLSPEHFVAYEAGFKAHTDALTLQLAYFYTDIEDMIVRTPTGNEIEENFEVTKRNGGDGYVHGIEFDARYRLCQTLTLFGALTWTEGKVDTYPTSEAIAAREYIDRLMPPTGRLGMRWSPCKTVWIEGACTAAAKADKLSTRDRSDTSRIPPGGTPGYAVYDIRANWSCTEDLKLSLAVENIADEDYRIHGSGINEAGRNVILAADWTF